MTLADTGWIIGAVAALASMIFAVCVFVVRSKDMQAWKPVIDSVPLIQRDIAEMRTDIAELKGSSAAVPAIQATQAHFSQDILELKQRVRDLERPKA